MVSWLVYLVASFIVLSYTYIFGGTIAFIFLYLLIIMPIVSFVLTISVLFFIKVNSNISMTEIQRKGIIEVTLDIENKSFLPFAFIDICLYENDGIQIREGKNLRFFMSPYSSKNISVYYKANNCGEYNIGINKVIAYDYLGLFKFTILKDEPKISISKSVKVLPRIEHLNNHRINENISNNNYSPTEINDEIREYRDGDKLNRIHWKLSSKMDKMFVRISEEKGICKKHLVVDLYREDLLQKESKLKLFIRDTFLKKKLHENRVNLEVQDEVLETALAISNAYISINYIVDVLVFTGGQWKHFLIKDMNSLKALQYEFLNIKINRGFIGYNGLRLPIESAPYNAGFTLITSNLDDGLKSEFEEKIKNGIVIDLVEVIKEEVDKN